MCIRDRAGVGLEHEHVAVARQRRPEPRRLERLVRALPRRERERRGEVDRLEAEARGEGRVRAAPRGLVEPDDAQPRERRARTALQSRSLQISLVHVLHDERLLIAIGRDALVVMTTTPSCASCARLQTRVAELLSELQQERDAHAATQLRLVKAICGKAEGAVQARALANRDGPPDDDAAASETAVPAPAAEPANAELSSPAASAATPQAEPSSPAAAAATPQPKLSPPAAAAATPQPKPSPPAAAAATPQPKPSPPAAAAAATGSPRPPLTPQANSALPDDARPVDVRAFARHGDGDGKMRARARAAAAKARRELQSRKNKVRESGDETLSLIHI